jgi:hypothetical protein
MTAISNDPIILNDSSPQSAVSTNRVPTVNSIPSATALFIPAGHDYFTVTGTTNIGAISGLTTPRRSFWDGRQVTLIFAEALTVQHNAPEGNILLSSGSNLNTVANTALTLMYNASLAKWLQV